MTDIATLGLAIDSRQVAQARAELAGLPAAAAGAQTALNNVSKASGAASAALASAAKASKEQTASLKNMQSALAGFAADLKKGLGDVNDSFNVGARGMDAIRARFNPLFAAGLSYKQQLGDLKDALRIGAISQKEYDVALGKSGEAFRRQVRDIKQGAGSYGLARHELVNLSRQASDVAVSLGSGQSFGTVLLQQGAQVADVFVSSGKGVGTFGRQLLGLVTPARLVAAGVAGLGAAAYFAYTGWKTFALQLDDTARRMGATTAEASKLQAAASFKGISTDESAKAMARFSDEVYQARNNMGGLADLLRANGARAGEVIPTLEKVADLVQRAGSESQKYAILQQAGLPPTAEWVRLLENGADGLRKARAEAASLGGAMNDQMVARARQFDEAWNKTWANFALKAKGAVVYAMEGIDTLIKRGESFVLRLKPDLAVGTLKDAFAGRSEGSRLNSDSSVASFYGRLPFNSGLSARDKDSSPARTRDPNADRNALNLEQQRLSTLGQLATVEQQVAQTTNAIRLARMSGVPITKAEQAALENLTRAQALGTYQIRQQTEAAKTEAGAVGLGTGAAAAFRVEQERLADFRLRGIKLTRDQEAAIRGEAEALGAATQRAAERRAISDTSFARDQLGRTDSEQNVANTLRQLYGDDFKSQQDGVIANNLRLVDSLRDIKSTGESALSGFLRDMRDGKSGAEAFGNVLNRLQDKLIDIAANKAMSALVGGGGGFIGNLFGGGGGDISAGTIGGTGGMLGGLYHSGRGPGDPTTNFRSIPLDIVPTLPRFHTGIGPGERAAVIRDDESVLTPGQMRAIGGRGGAAPIYVNINTLPGTTAEVNESRDQKGGARIDVTMRRMIDDTAADLVRGGKSNLHDAMKDRFNLRPAL